MKKDIESYDDIHALILAFYKQVRQDEMIAYIFNDVMKVDWDYHVPIICRFWESMLLGRASFKGNPMLTHIEINKKEKLTEAHFERWLNLWKQTIDNMYAGKVAENAKFRAETIGKLMLYKLRASEELEM